MIIVEGGRLSSNPEQLTRPSTLRWGERRCLGYSQTADSLGELAVHVGGLIA